jgi:hypothetical protein
MPALRQAGRVLRDLHRRARLGMARKAQARRTINAPASGQASCEDGCQGFFHQRFQHRWMVQTVDSPVPQQRGTRIPAQLQVAAA